MKIIKLLFVLSIVLLSTFTLTSALEGSDRVVSDKVVVSQSDDQWLILEVQNSLSNNTPVFIYFYSDLCHFCLEQSPIIDELEKNYTGNITLIHINKDKNPLEARMFNVTSIPAMYLSLRLNKSSYAFKEFIGLENYSSLSENFDIAISMEEKAKTEPEQQTEPKPQTEPDQQTEPNPQPENIMSTTYGLIFTLVILLSLAGVIIYLLRH